MPDDVGGRPPFPDGEEPDSHHRGGADEEFAAVVLDEDFVRAAHFHEPTAVERMVGAAEARAQAEAVLDEAAYTHEHDGELDGEADAFDEHGPYGPYGGSLRPYRGRASWHRPVALLLALVMGVGIVALVFAAVYRSSSPSRQDAPPPGGTTETSGPSGTTGAGAPEVSAVPR